MKHLYDLSIILNMDLVRISRRKQEENKIRFTAEITSSGTSFDCMQDIAKVPIKQLQADKINHVQKLSTTQTNKSTKHVFSRDVYDQLFCRFLGV